MKPGPEAKARGFWFVRKFIRKYKKIRKYEIRKRFCFRTFVSIFRNKKNVPKREARGLYYFLRLSFSTDGFKKCAVI